LCANSYYGTNRNDRMSITHGAVLVLGGKIYGKGVNIPRTRYLRGNNSSMHSEVSAIQDALRKCSPTHGKTSEKRPTKHHRKIYTTSDKTKKQKKQRQCELCSN